MTIAQYGLVDDDEIELDLAALDLSALDHPGVDMAQHVDLLQTIARRLSEIGADAATGAEQADALSRVFYDEYGFAGDVESYDAPLNGDLIRVLERRQGLPVSLSILYVAAARRMGWSAQLLNTPGHVLIRLGEREPVLADPFNGGMVVAQDQLDGLLRRAAEVGHDVSPGKTGPLSNRNVLVRLLMNQATRAEHASDPDRAMILYQRMTEVAPDNPDGWWSLARLNLAAGLIEEARRNLSAMLEVTRDADRRDKIVAVLERLASH